MGRLARLPRILQWQNYAKQRWVNGNGVTYEIGRSGEEGHPWRWRVSQADLTPGTEQEFSQIVGVDRTLILTCGTSISLDVKGMARESLELHRPFTFPADATTFCDVNEPGPGIGSPRDLNIMWDRVRMRAPVVSVITDALTVDWCDVPLGAEASFAVALGGPARISHQSGALECLSSLGACGEAVRFDHPVGIFDEDSRIRVLEGKAAVFSFVPIV